MATGFDRPTRLAIIARDGGCCVACGRTVADPETGRPFHQFSIQHRRSRGMGSTKDPVVNSAVNGLLMCGTGSTECHGYVESHPEWARTQGYRVDQSESPETVPVVVRTPSGDAVYGLDGLDRYLVYGGAR